MNLTQKKGAFAKGRKVTVTHLQGSEAGKKAADKILRPVLYGDRGKTKVNYEIDGWHPDHKAVLEIESGRGWQGNAFYRD
jgi:uncharacterized protein YndB with AHSA1/START domain